MSDGGDPTPLTSAATNLWTTRRSADSPVVGLSGFDSIPIRIRDEHGLAMTMEPVAISPTQTSTDPFEMNRELILHDEEEANVRILSSDPPILPQARFDG